MLPVTQCLIHWSLHPAHDWWYTDEGGGHMAHFPGPYDKQWHCPGLAHLGKHRGVPRGPWDLRDHPKGGAHRGVDKPEKDVDTGTPIR